MSNDDWREVTKDEPCENCGHPDWCGRNRAIGIGRCMRPEKTNVSGWAKDEAWCYQLTRKIVNTPTRACSPKERRTPEQQERWCYKRLSEMVLRNGASAKRAELADRLGVPVWTLEVLGTVATQNGWLTPECDALGRICGLHQRLEVPVNGKAKLYVKGSKAGLTYAAADWPNLWDGPVLIVEGMSDTAAGMTLGFSTIGRPSCQGGLKQLVPMLRQVRERRIVVVAERDRKKLENHRCACCMQCWPGKFGAMKLAVDLQHRLGRRVEWQLPPGGAKDLRAYLNQHGTDFEAARTLPIFGRKE